MFSARHRDKAVKISVLFLLPFRNLAAIQDREICCYSVSCKEKDNIGECEGFTGAHVFNARASACNGDDAAVVEVTQAGVWLSPRHASEHVMRKSIG